jgi:CheY-like chemotaxis protein
MLPVKHSFRSYAMTATRPAAPSILCVQCGSRVREITDDLLEHYSFAFAGSAFEALRALNYAVFDAYIIDYWLPDLAGVQLCREIRKTDPCARVLFCGTVASEAEELRAFRAGASACLQADVNASQLERHLRVVDEVVALHEPQATLDAEVTVRDELAGRVSQLLRRNGLSAEDARHAIERTLKQKAFGAFAKRGGTLASFERAWPTMFFHAWRSRDWQRQAAI